jgi:tetratricopeptide (TPR) repeat protein
MPGLFPDAELAALQQRTAGATQDRMLRELCEALEHLSVERPVVLALEDLQWSDLSTINVVSMLGSRRSPARLLVIGTARQSDLLQPTHPLKTIYRELLAHGRAQVVTPGALSPEMVSQYLGQRFDAHRFPEELATVVHGITGGTPLFMVSVVDDLVKQRLIAEADGRWSLHGPIDEVATRRPDNVGQLIDIQIDRLTQAEQRVLEVSSAIGMEFTAGLVAAALEVSVDAVEEACDGLVRREHALRVLGPRPWPDGTTQSRYAFRHNLYQAVALERSSLARRRVWHRKFAERLQAAYAGSTAEVAVELALHFERANDWLRAAEFYAAAGERAASRFAGLDATVRFKAGLDLVKRIPESPERDAVELRLLIGIAPRLIEQQISDPPWSMVHARILLLSRTTGLESPPWSAVFASWISSFIFGDLTAASLGAERLLAMAEERKDSEILASAIVAQAVVSFFRGKLGEARQLFDRSLAIYDGMLGQLADGALELNYPDSFLGTFRALWGSVLWMMGYPDQARSAVELSVEESRAVKSPYALALGWGETSHLHFWRREPTMVLQASARAFDLAVTHGFPVWRSEARVLSGWARVVVGKDPAAFHDLEEGLAERLALGSRATTLLAVVHADACLVMGEVERGLAGLDGAIAFGEDSGEGVNMAELHRLKGLLLGQTNRSDADAYLRRALEIAQASSAKAFELRAAIGLARLWQSSKHHPEAISRLAETVAWFTEGFSGADLVEAKQLLDEARQQRPQGRRRRA